VQGRYLLKTQMMEVVNEMVASRSAQKPLDLMVTNLYFTQFIVQ